MLLSTMLGVAALLDQEPMKWTGEVQAFAYYLAQECRPIDRVFTGYAVRKSFEDGTSVTLVRSAPAAHPGARAGSISQGIIERDPTGAATYISSRLTMGSSDGFTCGTEFKLDPKRGVLIGWGHHGVERATDLPLPDRKAYILDPLEAIAFGAQTGSSAWLLPEATYAFVDRRAPAVGLRYTLLPATPVAFELAGKREMFRRFTVVRQWIGSTIAIRPEAAGNLLFHEDGSFAAYSPIWVGPERLPSTVFWDGDHTAPKRHTAQLVPPEFAREGKLRKLWEEGMSQSPTEPFWVPTTVSSGEREALLRMIPDRPKAQPNETSDKPRDTSTVTPPLP